MEIDRKKLKKIFTKMDVRETDGKKHVRGWVMDGDTALFPIHYSHAKPLNGYVAHDFLKSLHLKPHELNPFVKCTISREEIIERAHEAGARRT